MTDKEKLVALLDEWEVPFEETQTVMERHGRQFDEIAVGDSLSLNVVNSPKVDGYGGFYTSFRFTYEGEFVNMGAWE